jgi:hypothetical protein
MSRQRTVVMLLVVFLFLLSPDAFALLRPGFHIQDAGWNASHIVAVRVGPDIRVVESWLGDLSPGDILDFPMLQSMDQAEYDRLTPPETQTSMRRCERRGYGGAVYDDVKYVKGRGTIDPLLRLFEGTEAILFLREIEEETEKQKAIARLRPESERMFAGGSWEPLGEAIVWVHEGNVYQLLQSSNPGPHHPFPIREQWLTGDPYSPMEVTRERFAELVVDLVTTRREFDEAAAIGDPQERLRRQLNILEGSQVPLHDAIRKVKRDYVGTPSPPAKEGQDPSTDWTDDFESYDAGPGTWPETWIADASACKHDASYVDGETFAATHGKTLRLYAESASWSALAYAPVNLKPSFKASFDVYSTQGCGGMTLREKPTWTSPGLGLLLQWDFGRVAMFDRISEGGRVTAGIRTDTFKISPEKWHHVELAVRQKDGAQTITVSVSDGESRQGPYSFDNPVPSWAAFTFVELGAEVGTVWYDNVKVESLPSDGRRAPLAPAAGAAEAVSPIEQEFVALIEQAKSADAAKRAEAVEEIIALRGLVAESLLNTVAVAEVGQAEPGSIASAFFLMGALGLPETKEMLAANLDRELKDPDVHDWGPGSRPPQGPVGGQVWRSAGFADTYALPSVPTTRTSLSKYPVLERALADLLSPERPVRHRAEDVVLEWYRMFVRSFTSVLRLRSRIAGLYSEEVRITAAFILGELRANNVGPDDTQRVLIENAGLRDNTGTRDQFVESLVLKAGRSEYPCIDALLKMGKRVHVDGATMQIVRESAYVGKLTEADRRRLGQVLVTIDAEMVEKTLDRRREWLENLTPADLPKQGIKPSERDRQIEALAELRAFLPERE